MFQAHLGFYDTVVAAPSQAAALRVWGTRQNLFADGEARVTDDPRAVEAALAQPETLLRRAVGSTDPYALEVASLPKVPDAPKKRSAKAKSKSKASILRKPADRSALNAAEAALHRLDDDRKREEAEFRHHQEELDAEREAAQLAYVGKRRFADEAVAKALKAYRKAGGRT